MDDKTYDQEVDEWFDRISQMTTEQKDRILALAVVGTKRFGQQLTDTIGLTKELGEVVSKAVKGE